MSQALDNVAKSLASPYTPRSDAQMGVLKAPPPVLKDFDRLNARHRMSLLVGYLTEGLSVAGNSNEVTVTDTTTGTDLAKITLKTDTDQADVRAFWEEQISAVHGMKWHRDDRLAEIGLQQTDILSFLSLPVNMGPISHDRTLILIEAILTAHFKVQAQVKRLFSLARPADIAPEINPVIQTPGHSAFPSGHATESFCVAAMLELLFFGGSANTEVKSIAKRIATNRSIAGVHYPCDSLAGGALGFALATTFAARLFKLDGAAMTASTVAVSHDLGAASTATADVVHDLSDTIDALAAKLTWPSQGALTAVEAGTTDGQAAASWLATGVLRELGL